MLCRATERNLSMLTRTSNGAQAWPRLLSSAQSSSWVDEAAALAAIAAASTPIGIAIGALDTTVLPAFASASVPLWRDAVQLLPNTGALLAWGRGGGC